MQAGRTLYVPREIQSSVPDPGAYATASWYRAAALAVNDKYKNKQSSRKNTRGNKPTQLLVQSPVCAD